VSAELPPASEGAGQGRDRPPRPEPCRAGRAGGGAARAAGPHRKRARSARLRPAACSSGHQSGKVSAPAATAVVLTAASVTSADRPRRCHSATTSPLQNCTCSGEGASGSSRSCAAQS
jgi:hypothetical protein